MVAFWRYMTLCTWTHTVSYTGVLINVVLFITFVKIVFTSKVNNLILSVSQALVKTGEHSWSLAELVHAVVLLAHFHALASFVFGSGVNPDLEVTEVNGVTDDLCPPAMAGLCTCHLTNSNQANGNPVCNPDTGVGKRYNVYFYIRKTFSDRHSDFTK